MTTDQILALSKAIYERFPHIDGWTFEYMYPGYFTYGHENVLVFFTPDFDVDGEISIQIQDNDGGCLADGTSIPYAELTAESLVDLVRPYLRAYP